MFSGFRNQCPTFVHVFEVLGVLFIELAFFWLLFALFHLLVVFAFIVRTRLFQTKACIVNKRCKFYNRVILTDFIALIQTLYV